MTLTTVLKDGRKEVHVGGFHLESGALSMLGPLLLEIGGEDRRLGEQTSQGKGGRGWLQKEARTILPAAAGTMNNCLV